MGLRTRRLAPLSWVIALSFGVLSQAYGLAQTTGPKPIDDLESSAVYSALLSTAVGPHRSTMIVETETMVSPPCCGSAQLEGPCWPSGQPMETEWKSALENLRAENSSARRVISGVTLDAKYIVMTRADVMAFFTDPDRDASWKRFYERFPDSAGSAAVSAVGFDPDRTRAIVYLSHHSASLGGDYAYHLFRKVDGQWQEVRVPGVDACQVWS